MPLSEIRARRWILPAGAGLGWALAQVVGTVFNGELQPVRPFFLSLSALAGGLAALIASKHFAGGKRPLRASLAGLALGTTLLVGLYCGFAVPVPFGKPNQSITFVVGWSRSGHCDCNPNDDVQCLTEMGLVPKNFRPCWNGVWAVQLAMALSYLLTLGSTGTLAGLLMLPARRPQGPQGYLDFDVWIDQQSDGRYRVKVWSGTAGFEATASFVLPESLTGKEHDETGIGARRGGSAPAFRGDGAGPEERGHELFHAVFQGELLKAFQGCLAAAENGPGLRIRLRLNDVPQLAGLPWEYLYDADGRGFLALSSRTPVVRYLELSERIGTLLVEPPLRVLAVIATPGGYQELAEADEEWRRLVAALGPLLGSGRIEVERLEHSTLAALEARLRTGLPVHVLHFVGHGGFSDLRGEGVLVFEDEEGNGAPVAGPSLAYLLQDHPSLRLAVLNACNGARASHDNVFAGTAQGLVQHGVPAVIAMHSEVRDETACSFAEKFYRVLAAGLPVDACVGEVRRALAAERNPEWGTPVLYLRATDGRLFALEGEEESD
jgi:CHAT domain